MIGVMIDGCPAGIILDTGFIRQMLHYRKPGQSKITTSRKEDDAFSIVSGIFDDKTTGAPICILIKNKDHKSDEYDAIKNVYRPSHADFTYEKKYGIRDHRGGGRSSARITAGWVAAGAIAEQILENSYGLQILAFVNKVHTIRMPENLEFDKEHIYAADVRCPHRKTALLMEEAILKAAQEGDSLGGTIQCIINNCPFGIGEPVFGKLNAQLAHAMMSINAVKGIEFGRGFDITNYKGSEMNDAFVIKEQHIGTASNNSGGIQGGISNGEPIVFTVAFKPTATIKKSQETVNSAMESLSLETSGRHDPCVLPRAVPIVEAMAALVLLDLILENQIK